MPYRILQKPDVSSIVIDNARAARLALEHLLALGHRKIAFFRGPQGNGDTEDRSESVRTAAAELRVDISSRLTQDLGKYPKCNASTMADLGYRAAKELLKVSRDFTALLAFNDGSAIGAIRAFRDAGFKVPKDISVIGFDDIDQAAFNVPRLTTIRQPLIRMGELAASTLIKRIEVSEEKPAEILAEPTLVVRESTAALEGAGKIQRTLRHAQDREALIGVKPPRAGSARNRLTPNHPRKSLTMAVGSWQSVGP